MDNCIFCKIIDNKIPSYKIFEDNDFIVFLDRFPSSVGHTLIVPKIHFENIYDINEEISSKLFILVKKIAVQIKNATKCEGLNILQNNGEMSGQSVNHFHVHLIPRYENDKVNFGWENKNPSDDEFENMIKLLNIN